MKVPRVGPQADQFAMADHAQTEQRRKVQGDFLREAERQSRTRR